MALQKPAELKPQLLKGIGLLLASLILFATMDTAGKHLVTKFNVPLVSAIRYVLNVIILGSLALPFQGKQLWQTQRTGLVVLRAVALAGGTLFMGLALQRMPLGETVAIIYLQSLMVVIASGLFLKEKVGLFGWLATICGFIGVLLIARPGSDIAPAGVAFALAGACVSVIYILLSRTLAPTESTVAMLFHVGLWGGVIFGCVAIWQWNNPAFTAVDVALLGYLGAGSLAGHFLLTSAYRYAPASTLAPFNYFHIAFAVMLGWLVYDHVPDAIALAGIALIAVSGAAVALQARKKQA